MTQKNEMPAVQALTIAALVLDFETENAAAPGWARECRHAAAAIRAAIHNPPPGWVTRAEPARHTNFNLAGGESRQRENSYTSQDGRRRRRG